MREKRKNISSSENRLRRHDTLRAAQIITSGVKTRGRPLRRGDKFPSSRLGVVTKKRAKIGKLTAIFRQLSYFLAREDVGSSPAA